MLPVVEQFYSIQGEGYWTGTPAYFIRLAGCDVGCKWCDQKESWGSKGYPLRSVDSLAFDALVQDPAIVVVTGGEPLMHDLSSLTGVLSVFRLHLETSAAYPLSGKWDWVTVSPKPHTEPVDKVLEAANELKIVVGKEADFKFAEEMRDRFVQTPRCFLQPCWGTNTEKLVFDYVLKNPHWRISLQVHKYLGVL